MFYKQSDMRLHLSLFFVCFDQFFLFYDTGGFYQVTTFLLW